MVPKMSRWLGCFGLMAIYGCTGGDSNPARPDAPPVSDQATGPAPATALEVAPANVLVPVSGTVTFGDAPLADATVLFVPIEGTAGPGAYGTTDDAGRYELESRSRDEKWQEGILPGKYAVKFSRMVNADGTVFDPRDYQDFVGTLGGRESIPTEYSLRAAFTVEVAKDKKTGYDFHLEKKE